VAKGFISPQMLDKAVSDAASRKASCEAARGDIEQSKSRIALARAGLDRMVLRAPFDGVVADISGELGEYATPSPARYPDPARHRPESTTAACTLARPIDEWTLPSSRSVSTAVSRWMP